MALAITVVSASPAVASTPRSTPSGGIGLRLVDVPAASKDPRARLYIVDHLLPGTTIERRVEVSNTTDAPQDVVLYAAAATIDHGTFVGAEGRTRNDLASWTTVAPPAATIAAGASVTGLVTLAVPADAAPGEQYGVVWAEVRSASTTPGGVAQVSRVGVRLYVSVGAGGAPASDFSVGALTAARSADGAPFVTATVRNTGGRALDMTGTLELSGGPGGLSAGPFPADLGSTLAIGDTQTVRIMLDEQVPDGPWDARITLTSGLTERSRSATLTFPSADAAVAVTAALPRSDSRALALAGGLGALLLPVAAGCALQRRRRHGLELP